MKLPARVLRDMCKVPAALSQEGGHTTPHPLGLVLLSPPSLPRAPKENGMFGVMLDPGKLLLPSSASAAQAGVPPSRGFHHPWGSTIPGVPLSLGISPVHAMLATATQGMDPGLELVINEPAKF